MLARTCDRALIVLRQRLLLHQLVENRRSEDARPSHSSDRNLGFSGVCVCGVVSGHGWEKAPSLPERRRRKTGQALRR